MKMRTGYGVKISVLNLLASSVSKATSGTSEKVRVDRTVKYSMTGVHPMSWILQTRNYIQAARTRDILKSGIWCSVNSTTTRTVHTHHFQKRTSIQAWGLRGL